MEETETSEVTYPDVHVELSGQDGNAFVIIGRVSGAIRKAHGDEAATRFTSQASETQSYDELLQFVMRTVETS
jgi:hypothetical protein